MDETQESQTFNGKDYPRFCKRESFHKLIWLLQCVSVFIIGLSFYSLILFPIGMAIYFFTTFIIIILLRSYRCYPVCTARGFCDDSFEVFRTNLMEEEIVIFPVFKSSSRPSIYNGPVIENITWFDETDEKEFEEKNNTRFLIVNVKKLVGCSNNNEKILEKLENIQIKLLEEMKKNNINTYDVNLHFSIPTIGEKYVLDLDFYKSRWYLRGRVVLILSLIFCFNYPFMMHVSSLTDCTELKITKKIVDIQICSFDTNC